MTTTSSYSYSSAQSPVSRVPYDVLREIFIHCLPRRRFREQQPDTTIAPMLLCQICSAWRTVALNSATLWSHLSYVFLIDDDGTHNSWKTHKDHLRFLSWWRRNQGTMAPSLCIRAISTQWYQSSRHYTPDSELEAVDMMSLVHYIASARYLEADADIWRMIYQWSDKDVHPNPHTLVNSESHGKEIFYLSQFFMSNHTLSALRFLSLSDDTLPSGSNFVTPKAWSKLTRIALNHVIIPLNSWLSFIRSVPELEWGYFDIILSDHVDAQYPKCTLPRLSELHISHILPDDDQNLPALEFPFSTLLTNVHLPALHTLTLNSFEGSWLDHRVLSDLYTVLNSTPAITTLTLGNAFLSLGKTYIPVIWSAIGNVEPLWRLATQLAHLEFKLLPTWSGQEEHMRRSIIDNIFHPNNHWLDLKDPVCTIRKITLIQYGSKSRSRWESLNDFTMSTIREHLEKAPNVNVVFDILIRDKERTAAGEWNEWGPNL